MSRIEFTIECNTLFVIGRGTVRADPSSFQMFAKGRTVVTICTTLLGNRLTTNDGRLS
jgi:hypothetical protein